MHFILYGGMGRPVISFPLPRKLVLFMRLTAFFLMVACMHVSARSLSQKVTVSFKNAPLHEVIREIGSQAGVNLIFNMQQLRTAASVTVDLKNVTLNEALTAVLRNQNFVFELQDGVVAIKKNGHLTQDAAVALVNAPPPVIDVSIRISDEKGYPVNGAIVSVKGTKMAYMTGENGLVFIKALDAKATLIITCIGFEQQEIKVGGREAFGVSLKTKVYELSTFEINTGISRRNKESFTGSATTITGEQLKVIGNRNIIESLKTLDPAFIKVDNNLQGSNPNRLPTIEVRGKTMLTNANLNDQFNADPNQPLFILDGFETTLQTIYDLDMNRVASISILKDAASTAMYGSKAANGVVVVETKRPVPGQLRMTYTGDFRFELPDLSSYNLMNASEKLRFDELTFFKSSPGDATLWAREERLAARRADVAKGINTYWLAEPVRTGFSNNHSVQLNGGNNDLYFNAGLLYGKQAGVMKGSQRDNWSGNMSLTYRKGKLNITEMATLSGNTSNESPYGSFANFAAAGPYYKKYNENGGISRLLDDVYDTLNINPLYNASLFSINQNKIFSFINNLRAIYTFSREIRVEAGLQMTKGNTTGVLFVPPDNTAFDALPGNLKGSYSKNNLENHGYVANLTLSLNKSIDKHLFSYIVRGQVQSGTSESTGFSAVGFPYGTNGNPAYAFGFTPYSTPASSKATTRSMSVTNSFNYTYDNRFVFDAVYTVNGSSAFGSNKKYKPFASGGLAWNLMKESFFRKMSWVNLLRIRGNVGYTGNENLGTFTSVSTYSFSNGNNNYFGQGLTLASLGSPNLEWSRTLQKSYGVDFSLLNNRLSGNVEYYIKKTDPMSVGATGTLPSSVAANSNYVINVGNLTTKGWNFSLRYNPVYDLKNNIIWSVSLSGAKVASKYGDFSNKLASLNKEQQDANGLVRYQDGYSPDDLWAVVSRGIDPANGKELFQKLDGTLTYYYNTDDIVRVGNTRPVMEGVVGTGLSWKNFRVDINARYRLGGYVFNDALYSKVENPFANTLPTINRNPNIDRRALYSRWQKPGDVSEFTDIRQLAATPKSSRFIQKDNHFVGESISFGWRSSAGWVKKLHIQTLSLNLFLNDIFRMESIQSERGLDYPFSRSAGFSVNVSF